MSQIMVTPTSARLNLPMPVIEGIEVHIPTGRLVVDDLVADGVLDAQLAESLGVRSVPVAEAGRHASDLMVAAGQALLDRLGLRPDELGAVVTASTVPPEYLMRTLAPHVASQLGARDVHAFDVYQGCNAFTAQVDYAISHVLAHPSGGKVLVLCGDRWDHFSERHVAAGLVFGDAGAAALIGTDRRPGSLEVIATASISDGQLYGMAGYPFGSRVFDQPGSNHPGVYQVLDSGMLRKKFVPTNFQVFEEVMNRALAKAGVTVDQVAGVAVPSGRADVMRKLLSHLGLEGAIDNVGLLSTNGDLSAVSPYRDILALSSHPYLDRDGVLLLLTQGGGMVWTATVLRPLDPPEDAR